MRNRVVETIYRLRDQATSVLRRITGGYQGSATEAERASRRIEAANRRQQTSLQGVLASVGRLRFAYFAVAGAVVGFVRGLAGAAQAASDQENAERRLATALKNGVGAREEEIEALKEQAAALQQVTRFGDEQTISAQAQLATFQLNAEAIQTLTPRALDLAEGMRRLGKDNVDVEQAAILLGKALRGNVGDLSRYGIVLTDAQKETVNFGTETEKVAALAEAIDANYKGLSRSLSPYEQAVQRSKNGTGDFVEQLGAFITTSPAVTGAINSVTDAFASLATTLEEKGGAINTFITVTVEGFKTLVAGARTTFNLFGSAAGFIERTWTRATRAVVQGLSFLTTGEAKKSLQEFVEEADARLAELEKKGQARLESLQQAGKDFVESGKATVRALQGQEEAQESANEASQQAQEEARKQKQAEEQKQAAIARTQETLKALGVDVSKVETGVSESARKTAQSLIQLAQDGESSLEVLAAAGSKAIGEFDPAEIDHFRRSLNEAFAAGEIGVQQYNALIQSIQQLKAETGETESDFSRLNKAIIEANGHDLTNIASEVRKLGEEGKLSAEEIEKLKGAIEAKRQATIDDANAQEGSTKATSQNTQAQRQNAEAAEESTGRYVRLGGSIRLAAEAQARFNQRLQEWQGGGTASYIQFWKRSLEEAIEANQRMQAAEARLQRLREQGVDVNEVAEASNRELRFELMKLRGEKERIAEIEERDRRRALEAQIDLARASGDDEQVRLLNERKRLMEQIAREEEKQARERERERQREEREQKRRQQSGTSGSGGQTSSSASGGGSAPARSGGVPRSDINVNINASPDQSAARLNPADLNQLRQQLSEELFRALEADARRTFG